MSQNNQYQTAAASLSAGSGLPRLHDFAYSGNAKGVKQCIKDGEELNKLVDLMNQNKQVVVGVTPLYLAAQQGHYDVCSLLMKAGADILRQCCIPATGEVFGPVDIALVHFHMRTWLLLKNRKQHLSSKSGSKGAGFTWANTLSLRNLDAQLTGYKQLSEPLLESSA